MKAKELRTLSNADLTAKEAELRKNLMKLYGQVSTGTPPKNPGEIRQSKRTLAKILTIKTENAKQKAVPQKAAPAKASAVKKTEARPKQ